MILHLSQKIFESVFLPEDQVLIWGKSRVLYFSLELKSELKKRDMNY